MSITFNPTPGAEPDAQPVQAAQTLVAAEAAALRHRALEAIADADRLLLATPEQAALPLPIMEPGERIVTREEARRRFAKIRRSLK